MVNLDRIPIGRIGSTHAAALGRLLTHSVCVLNVANRTTHRLGAPALRTMWRRLQMHMYTHSMYNIHITHTHTPHTHTPHTPTLTHTYLHSHTHLTHTHTHTSHTHTHLTHTYMLTQ